LEGVDKMDVMEDFEGRRELGGEAGRATAFML
jgi:hypothetical protein